jgi:xanthine dehydrogenase small subunit
VTTLQPPLDRVRFLLDGALHVVPPTAPTRTVLQYLREDLGRTGTKEGCAEGDCGACTVVLVERVVDADGERLRYRAVNACIQFVPALDGKALLTVESLKRGAALHPVQRALADAHGSQCGFCTPGFVMSLYALYKNDAAPDRRAINDAIAGNLCRCTGYRPIVAAASEMTALAAAQPADSRDWIGAPAGDASPALRASEADILAQLRSIARTEGVAFASAPGERDAGTFYSPRTRDELARLRVAHPDARLVAGSTDVGLWVTKQHRALGDVIYTGSVAELQAIRRGDAYADIGAAATITDVMGLLAAEYADFDELFRRYGSPPIRNAATLGGNIANGSPIGDSMPGLIALGSQLLLRRGTSTRQMPLEDFYLGYQKTALQPGEFVERIRVPRARGGHAFKTYKLSKRFDQDISAVCGAFAATIETGVVKTIRIAFGGMAATPKRALATEAALLGKPWNESTVRDGIAALATDYAPITDMRASADYRRLVAGNLLRKFHLETTGARACR